MAAVDVARGRTGAQTSRVEEIMALAKNISLGISCAEKFENANIRAFGPELVLNARTAVKFAHNTVSLAYALYRLYHIIPKVTNPGMRANNAKQLRQALVQKGFTIFPSLDAALQEHEQVAKS